MKEIDVAIKVDGLVGVWWSTTNGKSRSRDGLTCGRQHTAPMIFVKARICCAEGVCGECEGRIRVSSISTVEIQREEA